MTEARVTRIVQRVGANISQVRQVDLANIVDVAHTAQTGNPEGRRVSDYLYDRLCQLVNAQTMFRRRQLLTLVSQYDLPLIITLLSHIHDV